MAKMFDFEGLLSRTKNKTLDMSKRCRNEFEQSLLRLSKLGDEIDAELLAFSNTSDAKLLPKTSIVDKKRKAVFSDDNVDISLKKLCNSIPEEESFVSLGKPKRNALKLAQQRINQEANQRLNTKMRRPQNSENLAKYSKLQVSVKLEKLSTGTKTTENSILESEPVKSVLADVTNDNMPPPAAKPKRLRKKVKKEVEESDSENENISCSTRSSRKQQQNDSKQAAPVITNKAKDSDVFIQEMPVPVVILTDTDFESSAKVDVAEKTDNPIEEPVEATDDTNNSQESVASTKAKKPKAVHKGKKKKHGFYKKLKIKEEPVEQNDKNNIVVENETLYEDALSDKPGENVQKEISPSKIRETIELPSNTTFTVSTQLNLNSSHTVVKETHAQSLQKLSSEMQEAVKKTGVQLNCTVVLENVNTKSNLNTTKNLTSPWTRAEIPVIQFGLNSMLTSDEEENDDHSIEVTPPIQEQKAVATQVKNKKGSSKPTPMFSPYSNSPVKNRVAAFEKLKEAVDMPTRVTRTKTRLLAEKDSQNAKKDPLPVTTTSSRVPVKSASKYFTPLGSNKLPSMIPSTDSKFKPYSASKQEVPVRSATAVKPTRTKLQEQREEEQKRKMEREEEVKRKKDAILQAKIEEQRRKREEKQMKAQKTREAQDREKEEKLRRMLQEKEEKRQLEEQLKKTWLAQKEQLKKREKEKEEKLRIQILEQENLKKKLNQKIPPLPTGDLEDSGDEKSGDENHGDKNHKKKYIGPLWSQSQNLPRILHRWSKVPACLYENLFHMRPQTPDLCEIFEHVDERIMRRNSSAYWRTPPRLSTLPRF